jgi:sugar lactone lactonase YvrE
MTMTGGRTRQMPTGMGGDVGVDAVAMKPLLFVNDLDLAPGGVIYFTDSSWKYTRAEHAIEVRCVGSRSGRSYHWLGPGPDLPIQWGSATDRRRSVFHL